MERNSRHIFIGDVHGCISELDLLLEKIKPNVNDTIIFLGDLIDKGPDSIAVVKRFCDLKSICTTKLILGNHEEKFLRYLRHVETASGKEKEMKGIDEFPDLYHNLKKEEIESLRDSYYSLHFPEFNFVALHGGINNNLSYDFPVNYKYGLHLPKEYKGLDLITKTRFLSSDEKFVGLGEEKVTDNFWADIYNGGYGKVIFGHQPFIQESVKVFPFAYGIDTGCVFGGWLTAMIVDSSGIQYENVKALNIYSQYKP